MVVIPRRVVVDRENVNIISKHNFPTLQKLYCFSDRRSSPHERHGCFEYFLLFQIQKFNLTNIICLHL